MTRIFSWDFVKRLCFFGGFLALCIGVFIPKTSHAFQLTPSVIDVDLGEDVVTHTVTVTNTAEDERSYRAELRRITFAPDGSLASLDAWNFGESLSVSPETLTLSAHTEGAFEVRFAPYQLLFDQRNVALLVTEVVENVPVHASATVLFFLRHPNTTSGTFALDAFDVVRGGRPNAFEARATYTNTGVETVFPVATIVVRDVFGREMRWFPLHPNEGRLPSGTSRAFAQDLVLTPSFWHVGGPISFTLTVTDSVSQQGATWVVRRASFPGGGVLGVGGGIFVLLLWGVWYILRRRRVY